MRRVDSQGPVTAGTPGMPDAALYAGRWVALVQRRVVASGSTAQETFLHCRAERLKDEPILRYVPLRRVKQKTKSNESA